MDLTKNIKILKWVRRVYLALLIIVVTKGQKTVKLDEVVKRGNALF